MNHLTEDILELYVLKPQLLDHAVVQSIEAHVPECRLCGTILDYIRSFYDDLEVSDFRSSTTLHDLLHAQFTPPSVIRLTPFHHRPGPDFFGGKFTTVLAALSPATSPSRFEVVATLASEKEKTIVRILHDRESNLHKLYVLSDDETKRHGALISFPTIPFELVTDDRGRANFQLLENQYPADWGNLECLLQIPRAELHLNQSTLDQLRQSGTIEVQEDRLPPHPFSISYRNKVLSIEARPEAPPDLSDGRVVLQFEDGRTFKLNLEKGKAAIQLENLSNDLVVRVYEESFPRFIGTFSI